MSEPGSSKPPVAADQDGDPSEPISYDNNMFDDGRREIDYVLVYKKEKVGDVNENQNETNLEAFMKNLKAFKESIVNLVCCQKKAEDVNEKQKETYRQAFMKNLEKKGLEIETRDHMTLKYHVFVKIHAPWKPLLKHAELYKLKMPIVENDILEEEKPPQYCGKLMECIAYKRAKLPKLENFFTTMFSRTSGQSFILKEDDKEKFFTQAQRSLLVYFILSTTAYGDTKNSSINKIGIDSLVSLKIYLKAFPLHSVGNKSHSEDDMPSMRANDSLTRAQLNDSWVKRNNWYREQPFDHIRLYFGERIAMYFCWVGFYTWMLLPVTLIGLVVFCISLILMNDNVNVAEVCDTEGPGKLIMCPGCDKICKYWRLSDDCNKSKLKALSDNIQSVVFAAIMSLWCSLVLEFWKRRQAGIQFRWHVQDFQEVEQIRPAYSSLKAMHKLNPVNNHMEPHIGTCKRLKRYVYMSTCSVVLMLVLVVAIVAAVVICRIAILTSSYYTAPIRDTGYARRGLIITASLINLVCMLVVSSIYKRLSKILTDKEMHRTQSEWENSYILKRFLFDFVNKNGALLYIAFLKEKFVGQPNKYSRVFGYRFEVCGSEGCVYELSMSLAITFGGNILYNNLFQFLKVLLSNSRRKKKLTTKEEIDERLHKQMERDFTLMSVPQFGLIDEYFEMTLQYVYVTVYAVAMPLGPLFALINNIIEIRVDAYKFVTQYRRPVARRAQDIGIWYSILKGISVFAVLSNATIVAITSELIPRFVYRGMINDGLVNGTYTIFTHSKFNVSEFEEASRPDDPTLNGMNVTECYYQSYRHPWANDRLKQPPPYELTIVYWRVLAYRCIFIIGFSVVVGVLAWIITSLIPDMPHKVKLQILREKFLADEALFEAGQRLEAKKFSTFL